ncbi:MAG TPA: HI1506-related protein [Xanthobacteraceae bacterium]|nr:HI1506-related protein [Xanthobacteraceae bacterium]
MLVSVNVPTGVIAPETQDTLLAMADAAATALRSNREAVPGVRIVAKRDGFRRAGIAHSTAPATYPLHTLADEQLEALLAEPMLVVELVEDVGAP